MPLLLTGDDGLPDATVEFLRDAGTTSVEVVGGTGVVGDAVLSQLVEEGITPIRLAGSERYSTSAAVVARATTFNADSRDVWLAAGSNFPDALAAAPGVAREGAVLQLVDGGDGGLEGPARDLVAAWGPETTAVRIVGGTAVLPGALADDVGPLVGPRPAPGAFHVGSVALGDDASVTLAAVDGAASYEAYDIDGEQRYQGAEPVFPIPPENPAYRVRALDGAGAVLAERDVRATSPDGPALTGTRLAASAAGDVAQLVWTDVGAGAAPRRVTRYEVLPDEPGDAGLIRLAPGEVVSHTCGGSAVDGSRDAAKEYVYELTDLGPRDGSFCSGGGSPTVMEMPPLTSLRVPPDPTGGPAAARADTGTRAAPTTVDSALLAAAADGGTRTTGAAQEVPFRMRYQTFIRADLVPRLGTVGQFFNGNDRGFDPNSDSYKSRVTVDKSFGPGADVTSSKDIGETILYVTRDGELVEAERATGTDEGIDVFVNAQDESSAFYTILHEAPLPFTVLGTEPPAISYEVSFLLRFGGSNILGTHDLTPDHEIWGGPLPGEYIQLYTREIVSDGPAGFRCLAPLPGCQARIDVRF